VCDKLLKDASNNKIRSSWFI